jgi:hypothetical protein
MGAIQGSWGFDQSDKLPGKRMSRDRGSLFILSAPFAAKLNGGKMMLRSLLQTRRTYNATKVIVNRLARTSSIGDQLFFNQVLILFPHQQRKLGLVQ